MVANQSCSPNLIFRKENRFREDKVDNWPRKSTLNYAIFDDSAPNRLTRYQKIH